MKKRDRVRLQYLALFLILALGATALYFMTKDQPKSADEIRAQSDKATERTVARSLEDAKQWLLRNVNEKGLFVYLYDPLTRTSPAQNNELRQLMGSRVLALECDTTGEEHVCGLHPKNLSFVFTNWYREDATGGFIVYEGKSKLGATAMLLRTLVASPDFPAYEQQAQEVVRNILSLRNGDGSFRAWHIEPDYSYDEDYPLTFYSGEAIVALLEYAERTGDATVYQAAVQSANFYIDRYVTHMDEHYYPAYAPWHTIALTKLYEKTGERKYADAIFALNDKLLELLDTTEHVGRFYNPETPQYGSPHSSSDAVYTEGLAYALSVAQRAGEGDRAMRYRDALKLAVYNLALLQYDESPLNPLLGFQDAYAGALKINVEDHTIRVDTAQHMVDAFEKILEVWNAG